MPFREPGRLAIPLVIWGIIGVVAYLGLAPQSSLPGWQLALLIAAGIPLAGLVGFGIAGLLGLLVGLVFEAGDRRARRRFRRFLARLDGGDDEGSMDEARRLAEGILGEKEGRYRKELRNARPLFESASTAGQLQKTCVAILLRHGRDGGEQATALWEGRSAVEAEEIEAWVRWFSLWADPGEGAEEDPRPRAYAWAMDRVEGPTRRRVLNRLLTEARPGESWRSVARSLEAELRALDPAELAPLEREGLETLLGSRPASGS